MMMHEALLMLGARIVQLVLLLRVPQVVVENRLLCRPSALHRH